MEKTSSTILNKRWKNSKNVHVNWSIKRKRNHHWKETEKWKIIWRKNKRENIKGI